MKMQSLFDYEVETLTVDSSKLAEMQANVQKSFSFADWIKLLNMHKHNQSWKNVDRVVNSMHKRFLLRQAFCDRQMKEKIDRIDKSSREQVKQVFLMFDRSMVHGQYVELAKKFCNFVLEMYTRGTITLSVAENKVEGLYSKFKEDIENGSFFLHKLRKLYKTKQCPDGIMKIRRAYQQELSTPFAAIDVTLDEYLSWEKDQLEIERTKEQYEQTKLKLDAMNNMTNEQKIKNSSPRTVLNLLENENNLNLELYLQKLRCLPTDQQIERLCRQSKQGRFVDQYINLLEKQQTQYEILKQQLGRLIQHCQGKKKFQFQKKYLELLTSTINRHLTQEIDEEYTSKWVDNVTQYREAAENIITENRDQQKKVEILNMWADVECYVVSDISSTKIVSDRVVQLTKDPKFFKEYFHRLIFYKDYKEALRILEKAIEETAQPSQISGQLRRFQILFGQKAEIEEIEFNGKPTPKKEENGQPPATPVQKPKRQRQIPVQEAVDEKIENEVKRRHHTDSGKTIFMNHIPQELTQKQIIDLLQLKNEISQVRIVKDKNGISRGFCYIDYKSAEAAESECRQFKHPTIQVNISRPYKQYTSDEKTLFLCGLPSTATEAKVKDVLGSYSNSVAELRLIQNQEGTRGYCYVEFESEQVKAKAFEQLLHKKLLIDGKRILIQQCDSNRQKSKKANQVIFLQGLAYKATEQDVRDFFQHYKVQPMTIEIPRAEGGKSRGIAFVEFEKFVDFQKALDLKEGRIHHRDFKILRSDRQITHKKQKKEQKLQTNDDFSNMCA